MPKGEHRPGERGSRKKKKNESEEHATNRARSVPLDLYLRRRIEINEVSCFFSYFSTFVPCVSYTYETPYFRGIGAAGFGRGLRDAGFKSGLIRESELRCHWGHEESSRCRGTPRISDTGMEKEEIRLLF